MFQGLNLTFFKNHDCIKIFPVFKSSVYSLYTLIISSDGVTIFASMMRSMLEVDILYIPLILWILMSFFTFFDTVSLMLQFPLCLENFLKPFFKDRFVLKESLLFLFLRNLYFSCILEAYFTAVKTLVDFFCCCLFVKSQKRFHFLLFPVVSYEKSLIAVGVLCQ